jgi:hypothetical protein
MIEFGNPTYDAGSGPVSRIDSANLYIISAEAAPAQATTVIFGDVVGSGDDRQGIRGGVLRTAGPSWKLDFASDIADLVSVSLYGLTVVGAGAGILFDDGNKTSVISCTFVNCGEVQPGTTNNGAEILSCIFIDPDDYALEWPNTTHNVKKISFITSGTPTTQYMCHFTQAADYSISFDGIKFFGNFASGTLWHGENDGLNADVTINAVAGSGSNPDEDEFTSTNGGTVSVVNTVTLKVTVRDTDGVAIENAQTAIYDSSGTELMNEDTLGTGVAEESFEYPGSDVSVIIRVRKGSSTDTPKYIPIESPQLIKDTGLDVTITMREDIANNS